MNARQKAKRYKKLAEQYKRYFHEANEKYREADHAMIIALGRCEKNYRELVCKRMMTPIQYNNMDHDVLKTMMAADMAEVVKENLRFHVEENRFGYTVEARLRLWIK